MQRMKYISFTHCYYVSIIIKKRQQAGDVIMQKYHMRRTDREIKDPVQLSNILHQGKFMVLALTHLNEPYIVTLSYGYDEKQNHVYFHCAKEGLKLQYIAANPRACATVIIDKGYIQEECAHPFTTLVLRGSIEMVDDVEDKKHGISLILNHLEANPTAISKKVLQNDQVYEKICVLRMTVEDISGKAGK